MWNFPRSQSVGGLLCRHGCSDHMCRHLRCVSLPDVSNVMRCDLGGFPLEPNCHGCLTAIWLTWVTLLCFTYFILSWPDQCHFIGSALHTPVFENCVPRGSSVTGMMRSCYPGNLSGSNRSFPSLGLSECPWLQEFNICDYRKNFSEKRWVCILL